MSSDWFDRVARVVAGDMSRRQALRLFAGAAVTAVAGSWLRPGRAFGASRVAAADPGCSGIRTFYRPDCPKPVPKLGHKPSFNGCGPENGVNVVPNAPFGVANFLTACNGHDVCYGTCNENKDNCDSTFFSDMKATCTKDYPGNGIFDSLGRSYCLNLARHYYNAVSLFGRDAYKAGQKGACDCCDVCPGGAPRCADTCCRPGQTCVQGRCCSPCENGWIPCPVTIGADPENFCGFLCCNPATPVCCPGLTPGRIRCCPGTCFKGGCG